MNYRIKLLKKLIKLSNKMDMCDKHKSADIIDGVITNIYTDIDKDEALSADYTVKNYKGKHSYMTKPQLAKIHEMSSEIFFMLDDNEEVEDWQETKIAEMAAAIEDVYNSMRYHKMDYGIQKYNKVKKEINKIALDPTIFMEGGHPSERSVDAERELSEMVGSEAGKFIDSAAGRTLLQIVNIFDPTGITGYPLLMRDMKKYAELGNPTMLDKVLLLMSLTGIAPFIPGVKGGAAIIRSGVTANQAKKLVVEGATIADNFRILKRYFDELPTNLVSASKRWKNEVSLQISRATNIPTDKVKKVIDKVHEIYSENKELIKYGKYALARLTGTGDQAVLDMVNNNIDRIEAVIDDIYDRVLLYGEDL